MTYTLILVLLSSVGLALALFFAVYLLFTNKWKSLANTLLALLLIALSLRIGKAIFYNFVALPLFVKNLGLAANLAAAPLLYLYGKALLDKSFRWQKATITHLIPAFFYAIFCWQIPNGTDTNTWTLLYSAILIQSYIYVWQSLRTLAKHQIQTSPAVLGWYRSLVLGLLAIWLVYGLIFIQILPYHIAGGISFSMLMIALAYIALNKALVFKGEVLTRYQHSKHTSGDLQHYIGKIKGALRDKHLYLQPDLTINRLSECTNLHPKLISEAINRYEGQNFVSFINQYRIDEAKRLLRDKKSNDKIATIAFHCGFNSLSAFNTAFKNSTSLTPSQFRSRQ